MHRLRNFYRGAADPNGVRLAFGCGALWIIVIIVWMTGIFSTELEEEIERAHHAPIPTAEQFTGLYSGHSAPAVPTWPREVPGERPPSSNDAKRP